MHQPGEVCQESQEQIEPEMHSDPDFEKHTKRRDDHQQDDPNEFHVCSLWTEFWGMLHRQETIPRDRASEASYTQSPP